MGHDIDKPYEFAVRHTEEEGKAARKSIWLMFWVLLAITTVEVLLGIFWKDIGVTWSFVKMTFIGLTILKAYFIVAYYMHLKHESSFLKNTIILPFVMLALYLIYMLITESTYIGAETIGW